MLFFCFSLFRKEESEHHENVSDTQLTFLSLSIVFFLFCCCWERNLSSVVVIFHEVTESVTRDGVGPTENIKNLFILRFDFVKFSFTQMLHHCLCYHITYLYVVLRFKPFKFDYLTLCLTSMI